MNINFGMDNFYVRYLKRFLASEMPQTNMVLGEFDKDDQQLLIQYLNLPNIEPMSRVQRTLNSMFPQLKSLFIMNLQDNHIIWTSKTISHEVSQWLMDNIDTIKDYCTTVGWELEDAYEWVDDLMDINSDGVVDEADRRIMHDIVYNNHGYDIEKGRITGKLVNTNIKNWDKLNANISLYNSYNQKVAESSLEMTNHTYLFRDLDKGTYKIVVTIPGYLKITVNNIYVKTGYLSQVQDINFAASAGDVDGDGEVTINDKDEFMTHYGKLEGDIDYDIKYDLNRDGQIQLQDLTLLTNFIGRVNSNLYWTENMTEMDTKSRYSSEIRKKADINMDGVIDQKDLNLLEDYLTNGRIHFSIKSQNRKNYFPNKDMLIFINQFDGTFLYDYAIRDGGTGVDNLPHKNNTGLFKIALYKCKPNQKITIAHNNNDIAHLVIGSSSARLKQDVTSFMLQNVVEVDLNPRRKLSIPSKW